MVIARVPVAGVVAGLACAVLLACASAKQAPMASSAPASTGAEPMPGDPRGEIDELDRAIDDQLAQMQLSPVPAPCSATGTCAQARPQPMTATSRVEDPTCRPADTTTCTDVCTLSDSICANASKICSLAERMGGADAYANEKCEKGTASCQTARDRCCGCT